MTDGRTTRIGSEVGIQQDPDARTTRVGSEVGIQQDPDARTTRVGAEVAIRLVNPPTPTFEGWDISI